MLHDYLKNKRMLLRVRQAEIAEELGCTPQYVCNFERGACSPSYELLAAYIRVLGVGEYEEQIKEEIISVMVSGLVKELRGNL